MLTAALVAVAVTAGLAGSWSPCGLSMVDTLAPAACDGRRRTSALGALAFAAGALGGGAVTFGGLALLGNALGAGGGAAAAVAAAALLTGAVGDAAGRRILPQVRRQVPESWRRVLPLPLAAGLYGVLLGLGFTTFVLSFATWALAAACLAVGAPATGLAVGLAFGLGRAIPVGLLGPLQDREGPAAVAAAMGDRPVMLRGLRLAAAAGLTLAAAALLAAPPAARAAGVFAESATDPSANAGLVAYQATGGGPGVLVRGSERIVLPGTHPAVSDGLVAWLANDQIVVADAATLTPRLTVPAPGADALDLSNRHVVWRAPGSGGRDGIFARALAGGDVVTVATAGRGGSLGRPVLDGDSAVFDEQTRAVSRIVQRNLSTGGLRTLRRAKRAALLQPSMVDRRLMYVRSTSRRQQVILGRRVVYSTAPTARSDDGHERGKRDHREGYPGGRRPAAPARPPAGVTVTLWTTAFDGATAYVTQLRHRRGGRVQARILRFSL